MSRTPPATPPADDGLARILARRWLLQLPDGREIVRRYQEPVTLARVLDEHRSALAAWPVEG